MRRITQGSTLVLGCLAVLLLGSGLIARLSDTANSTGHLAEAGDFHPARHDIVIAQVASTAPDCSAAAYDNGLTFAFIKTSVDLDSDGSRPFDQPGDFCVKNAGTGPGRLTLQFTNVIDDEAACSTGESSSGGDTSCGVGIGELRPMLLPQAITRSGAGDCVSQPAAAWSTYETGKVLDVTMAAGEVCRVHVLLNLNTAATDTMKYAAQSDRIGWTVSFILQD